MSAPRLPWRRNSRWTAAQSGSAFRRWPGVEPPSCANSSASGPCSVSVAGSGQLSPAAAKAARHSCTVLRGTAMARSERPHSNFNRRISRTRRIDTLSAGIGAPLALTREKTAHRPSSRATSLRGGRLRIGTANIKSECLATCSGIRRPVLLDHHKIECVLGPSHHHGFELRHHSLRKPVNRSDAM
jgi:hypothetical protein